MTSERLRTEGFEKVDLPDAERAQTWFNISFDVDAEALWLTLTRGKDRPALFSQGLYGLNVGMPRILQMLDDLRIRATFFVPGLVADRHPALVPELVAAGHEIASHAYTHLPLSAFQTRDAEADELKRARDVLESQSGRPVLGFGAPVCDVSVNTLSILTEQGILYDRSFLDDDWPYLFRTESGRDLVELPISWVLDDFAFFGHNLYPQLGWGIQSPEHVADIWHGELQTFARDGGFGCLVLHPEVIGRRPRMTMLKEVLCRFVAAGKFFTCEEIAADVKRRMVESVR